MQLDNLALDGRENTPVEELKIADAITHAYAVGKRLLRHKGKRLIMYVVIEPNVIVPESLAKDLEDHYDAYTAKKMGDLTPEFKAWHRDWITKRDHLFGKLRKENIAK